MVEIFEAFKRLSGLEINEGKTKVIRIGANLENITPITEEVKFKYVTSFTLLGVEIDNKLCNLSENYEIKKKRILQKIAIWRKLNLSTIGNLIISKTFLISQLGYLLSMMDCPRNLCHQSEMQLVQKAKPRFMEGHPDGQGEPYGKHLLHKRKAYS